MRRPAILWDELHRQVLRAVRDSASRRAPHSDPSAEPEPAMKYRSGSCLHLHRCHNGHDFLCAEFACHGDVVKVVQNEIQVVKLSGSAQVSYASTHEEGVTRSA